MKKHLLLATAVLACASSAFAALPTGTQVTNESLATDIVDNAIIALQCLDTNGGTGYYFNGAAVKTSTLSYSNFYAVRMQEDNTFALQSLDTEEYVGSTGTTFTGNESVAMTTDLSAAAKFTVSVVSATDWTSKWDVVENGVNTIRFTVSGGGYLNTNNTGYVPKYFGGTGGFSIWYVYTFTEEEANYYQTSTYAYEYFSLLEQGNTLAAIEGYPTDRVTAWQEAIATDPSSYNEAAYTALKNAYGELVDGVHMQFGSCKDGCDDDYLSQLNGVPRRWSGGDGCRVFTLQNADGVGFYVLNEYLQQYIVHPTANNSSASYSSEVSDATVYNIDVYDADLKQYGIYSTQSGLASDQLYWHSNNSNELWRWQKDINSSWYISLMSDDQAATECLQGAIDLSEVDSSLLGTGVGEYSVSSAYTEALAAAESVAADTDATNAEKRSAASALRAAVADGGIEINPVTTGFYRIKNVANNLYLGSDIYVDSDHNRLQMISGNYSNTVWYYDAENQRLIAFANGLCLGTFNSGESTSNRKSWATALNGSGYDGDITFTACGATSKYSMFSTGSRRLFGNTSRSVVTGQDEDGEDVTTTYYIADAGGNDQDASRWTIETVEWLPVSIDTTAGYGTLYSPVALDTKSRVKVHTGTINGATLEKNDLETTTIPANTPVLLEYAKDIENGHVFFQIVEDAVSAQADAVNHLVGGIYATEKDEEKSYYTVALPEGENSSASFVAHTDDYVPGFAAHLPVTTTDAQEAYVIVEPTTDPTLSITEIGNTNDTTATVIYDLQGRRVSSAAKGLYIINGVKTLVK